MQSQSPGVFLLRRREKERSQPAALELPRDVKVLENAVPNGGEPAGLTVAGNGERDQTVSQDNVLDPLKDLGLCVQDREVRHGRASGGREDCSDELRVRSGRASISNR